MSKGSRSESQKLPRAVCRNGELCGGSRHRLCGAGVEPCECYYTTRQLEWFKVGRFSDEYASLTAKSAVATSGAILDPERLRAWAILLMERKCPPILIERDVGGVLIPSCLGSYLMLQIALRFRVWSYTLSDIVHTFFRPNDIVKLNSNLRDPNFGLMLRIGNDPSHSWNGPSLAEFINQRNETKGPTVIVSDRPLAHVEGIYTPFSTGLLVRTCARIV